MCTVTRIIIECIRYLSCSILIVISYLFYTCHFENLISLAYLNIISQDLKRDVDTWFSRFLIFLLSMLCYNFTKIVMDNKYNYLLYAAGCLCIFLLISLLSILLFRFFAGAIVQPCFHYTCIIAFCVYLAQSSYSVLITVFSKKTLLNSYIRFVYKYNLYKPCDCYGCLGHSYIVEPRI